MIHTDELRAFFRKFLAQIAITMGDGSRSADFCAWCYGRSAMVRGIHQGSAHKCDCFCHEGRAIAAKLEQGQMRDFILAHATPFVDPVAVAELQKPAEVVLEKPNKKRR